MIRLLFEGDWTLRRGTCRIDNWETAVKAMPGGRSRGWVSLSPRWVRGLLSPNGSLNLDIHDGYELKITEGFVRVPYVGDDGYFREVEWYSHRPRREQCECGRTDCFTDSAEFSWTLDNIEPGTRFGKFPVNGIKSDSLFDNSTLPEFVVKVTQR